MPAEFRMGPNNLIVLAEARVMELLEAFAYKGVEISQQTLENLMRSFYAQGFVDASGAVSTEELEMEVDNYLKRHGLELK
jgi:hypothetical protein